MHIAIDLMLDVPLCLHVMATLLCYVAVLILQWLYHLLCCCIYIAIDLVLAVPLCSHCNGRIASQYAKDGPILGIFNTKKSGIDFLIRKYDEFKIGQQIATRFLGGYQEVRMWLLERQIMVAFSQKKMG
jgi:hypothetical protein